MKKYLSLSIVLAMVFIAAPVNAEETEIKDSATFKTRIEANRIQTKTRIDALRVNIKNERDSAKARIKETRISLRERALGKFDMVLKNMNDLESKVNVQINKFEAKGVDVTKSKSFAATAEVKLNAAEEKVAEINALLSVSIDELTPENKTKLRALAADAQNLIREAHRALSDAVKALREAVSIEIKAEANATVNTQ